MIEAINRPTFALGSPSLKSRLYVNVTIKEVDYNRPYVLEPPAFDELAAALQRPPTPKPRLRLLLSAKNDP